jgi:carboxyl-terminal processing protease
VIGGGAKDMAKTTNIEAASFNTVRFRPGFNSRKVFAVMMVSLAVSAAYIAWFWYNQLYASPVELYHRTWQTAGDNYFEKADLSEWKKFEHCYDSKIKNDEDAVLYANKMLSTLGDPYTALHSKSELDRIAKLQQEKFVGIGVFLEQVKSTFDGKTLLAVKSLMPGGPAGKAGLKPGDAIISIDKHKGTNLTIEKLREIVSQRENKPTAVIVKRGLKNLSVVVRPSTVIRKDIELIPSNRRIAHIVIRNFMKKNTAEQAMKVLERTAHRRGIVLDLRDNPGGSVEECLKLATAFLNEGPLVTLKVREVGGGHFRQIYTAKRDCLELKKVDDRGKVLETKQLPRLRPIASKRPLIVLINNGSASAAEMLAAALHDNGRARLVGTRSFGKGIAQAGLPIANGTVLTVTCVHYFTPGGRFLGTGRAGFEKRKTEHRDEGINPDITVPDSLSTSMATSDPQMNMALKLLEQAG